MECSFQNIAAAMALPVGPALPAVSLSDRLAAILWREREAAFTTQTGETFTYKLFEQAAREEDGTPRLFRISVAHGREDVGQVDIHFESRATARMDYGFVSRLDAMGCEYLHQQGVCAIAVESGYSRQFHGLGTSLIALGARVAREAGAYYLHISKISDRAVRFFRALAHKVEQGNLRLQIEEECTLYLAQSDLLGPLGDFSRYKLPDVNVYRRFNPTEHSACNGWLPIIFSAGASLPEKDFSLALVFHSELAGKSGALYDVYVRGNHENFSSQKPPLPRDYCTSVPVLAAAGGQYEILRARTPVWNQKCEDLFEERWDTISRRLDAALRAHFGAALPD